MALPSGIKTVEVTVGPYITADGKAIRGSVTFTPSRWLIWQPTGTPIVRTPIKVDLDSNGRGLATLMATDQTGFVDGNQRPVTDWTWDVTVTLTGVSPNPPGTSIVLPVDTPSVDLDLLVPTATSVGIVVARPEVVSVVGEAGAVTAEQIRDDLVRIGFTGGGGGGTSGIAYDTDGTPYLTA